MKSNEPCPPPWVNLEHADAAPLTGPHRCPTVTPFPIPTRTLTNGRALGRRVTETWLLRLPSALAAPQRDCRSCSRVRPWPCAAAPAPGHAIRHTGCRLEHHTWGSPRGASAKLELRRASSPRRASTARTGRAGVDSVTASPRIPFAAFAHRWLAVDGQGQLGSCQAVLSDRDRTDGNAAPALGAGEPDELRVLPRDSRPGVD